ncbi:MAG TPA: restriction endonuclease subunit S [Edaphocola sp.]|nr:restriction endonuclease subunit S [Edaphocola sp.]
MKKNNKMSEPRLSGLNDELELKTKKNHSNHINQTNQSSDNMQAWEIKKLGEVCETGAGGTPLKTHKDYYEGGTIPWLLSGEVSQGEIYEAKNFITEEGLKNSSAKLFPPNTVLVAMYGATAGQVGILRFEASTNQAVCGILPNDKTIPEYIFYCFLEKKEELVAQAVGGAQPNISQIKIKNTKIPLPPLPEQQRIVSILDKAFAYIERSRNAAIQNLKNAKELFESYLEKCLNPDSNDLLDYPDSKKENKKKSSNQLNQKNDVLSPSKYQSSDKWEVKNIKEVCELKSGTTISTNLERSEGDVLYVKVGDMTLPENEVEINTSSRFVNSNEMKPNQIIPIGATIFPKRGGAIATNKKRIIVKPTIVDLNTMAIIPGKQIDAEYFFHWFQLIDLNSLSNGTSIPQINNYSFDDVKIPFPKSLATQQTIVHQLDALRAETQKMEAVYQQKIANLDELKKSILQKAFSGGLNYDFKND